MMLLIMGISLFCLGFTLFYLTKLIPLFTLVYFDYIGLILCFIPFVIVIYRMMVTSKTYDLTEKIPKWKHFIAYMRRDNTIVPVKGERTYPGESFLEVPKLGLVEFLGKDCWYTWGDKKIVWGLENMQFTPDPRYSNLCHLLDTIGFKDSNDVSNVLNGHDLHLMGKTYLKMNTYDKTHGVNKLVQDMKTYDKPRVVFKDHIPQPTKTEMIHDRIDQLIHTKIRVNKKND